MDVPKQAEGMRSTGAQPSAEARERLLEAAEKLFAEKGYAATRVQEITDAAGVNKALLYYYFEDKRSVYVALVEEAIAAFDATLQEALAMPGSYTERLRHFIRQHVLLMSQRSNLLRMIQRSQATGEVEGVCWLKDKFHDSLSRLVAFFTEAAASGEFSEIDPEMAALSVIALNSGFANIQADRGCVFEPELVAEHSANLLLDGFRRR
jgi:AcrR family transcriptional regulator